MLTYADVFFLNTYSMELRSELIECGGNRIRILVTERSQLWPKATRMIHTEENTLTHASHDGLSNRYTDTSIFLMFQKPVLHVFQHYVCRWHVAVGSFGMHV